MSGRIPLEEESIHLLHQDDGYSEYGSGNNVIRRTSTRRRSTVPGLSDVDYMRRSRYRQFYTEARSNDTGQLYQGDGGRYQDRGSVKESINFHLHFLQSCREQPWPMRQKIQAAEQAREFLRLQTGRLDTIDSFQHRQLQAVRETSRKANDTIFSLSIWKGKIKKIEAYFGTGVSSYFVFLRTLLWLNLVMGVLVFCFISLPQVLIGDGTVLNATFGLDFVQNTIFFYGFYDSSRYVGSADYMLPLAYFMTNLVVILYCVISIVMRMSVKYKKTKKTGTTEDYPFSWRLFCSWDHSVTTREGVKEKISAIRTDFKVGDTSSSTSPVDVTTGNDSLCCWETVVGEEIFKVVLLDIAASILAVLGTDALRACLVKCLGLTQKLGYGEFSIATSVLELIYGQGLIWLGLYFSPLLPLIAVVKLVILFYYRYYMAKLTNVPPQKMFRASRSGNFYLALLLTTLLLCLIPVALAVIVIPPSRDCGPFRALDHVYDVLLQEIGVLPTWLQDTINIILSPAVFVPVIIILILVILYYRAQASSYRDVIADLRMQLHFERSEGKRKVFAAAAKRGQIKKEEKPVDNSALVELPEEP
ncbi:transmembrane channel-like protein 3 [Lingula anatina]|uniref:Transmembrane channel-like protein 3 n=1 Tax=Lingula anatina TaxID=7574 RepID=A0A1S3HLS3_LINAN|nr:transmembrane channel-like protein 3 [Lingula anatina]|eukprot:XP_013387048.1 transmembrane channel-like protein 3 [Lingula anatina]